MTQPVKEPVVKPAKPFTEPAKPEPSRRDKPFLPTIDPSIKPNPKA